MSDISKRSIDRLSLYLHYLRDKREQGIKDISSVKGILSNNYSALITDEGMKSLTYNGQVKYSTVYIHVLEDSNCETF